MNNVINSDEYGEYFGRYVKYSNGSDLLELFSDNRYEMMDLIKNLNDQKALYRYEEGKWSVKEVLGHVIDTERIFNYRALTLARREKNPIPGYNHDQYMKVADFDRFTLSDLQNQYSVTRDQTISLFGSFNDEELLSKGVVNNSLFSVRALGYVIAGHEMHHRSVLKERYHRT
jgi:uncharacterized damage-inducible protein DinB